MKDQELKIDVGQVLRERVPRYYRYIPKCVVGWLERTVHQDELNQLLERGRGLEGVPFAQHALRELDIKVDIRGLESLDSSRRYILASNHPLGGVDGLALIASVGEHYDGNIRFMVNDLLMAVKPLRSIFLPVNKFGRQSRRATEQIDTEYASDKQMLTFPAGLCSRLQGDGTVSDLEWHKRVVVDAVRNHRDVVPVYVDAHNSRFFYRLARCRSRLGIKFNIEMLYLPDEMFKQRHTTLRITVGQPIGWQEFDASHPREEASRLRATVYNMKGQ